MNDLEAMLDQGGYDYTLDEVKKAQKAVHGKIETTDGKKQTMETTQEQQIVSSDSTETKIEIEIDKEKEEEEKK